MPIPRQALQIGVGLIQEKLAQVLLPEDLAPFLEMPMEAQVPTVSEFPHKNTTAHVKPPKIVTTR